MRVIVLVLLAATVAMIPGCGGGGGSTSGPEDNTPSANDVIMPAALNGTTGTVQLTASPLNLSDIAYITPLGNLNPPGHTIPTTHMYFVLSNGGTLRNVYAPANGYIIKIRANTQLGAAAPNDFQVFIAYTSTMYSYFGHVLEIAPEILNATGPITTNGDRNYAIPVTAGQVIGKTGQGSITMCLDFGLINLDHTASLVNPSRYEANTDHKDSPLRYYAPAMASQLYNKVNDLVQDKDGKFDYDVAGTLAGNWYGSAYVSGGGSSSDACQISFCGSYYNQAKPLISMGGDLGLTGYYELDLDATPFAGVTAASGAASYKLYRIGTNRGTQEGLLLAQLTDSTHVKLQLFPGAIQSASFTAAAKTYAR